MNNAENEHNRNFVLNTMKQWFRDGLSKGEIYQKMKEGNPLVKRSWVYKVLSQENLDIDETVRRLLEDQ